jgi:hypothetical protein
MPIGGPSRTRSKRAAAQVCGLRICSLSVSPLYLSSLLCLSLSPLLFLSLGLLSLVSFSVSPSLSLCSHERCDRTWHATNRRRSSGASIRRSWLKSSLTSFVTGCCRYGCCHLSLSLSGLLTSTQSGRRRPPDQSDRAIPHCIHLSDRSSF